MCDLNRMSQFRRDLLLAELAAWLHDIGKFSNEFIESHSKDADSSDSTRDKWHHELVLRRAIRRVESHNTELSVTAASKDNFKRLVEILLRQSIPDNTKQSAFPNPKNADFLGRLITYLDHLKKNNYIVFSNEDRALIKECVGKYRSELQISESFLPTEFYDFAESSHFEIFGQRASIADLIEQHGDPVDAKTNLVRIFKPPGCDAIDSALDKGKAESQQTGSALIANAFGFEGRKVKNIETRRMALSGSENLFEDNRSQRKDTLKSYFTFALGETRRPANDVTLWDHSYSVGVLYRTLLTKILLTEQEFPSLASFIKNGEWIAESWRYFSVRLAGLEYIIGGSSVPDLLSRKGLIKDSLDRVQTLMEETYLLGLEVYRDENGSLFVVPDIGNPGSMLDGSTNENLHQLLIKSFCGGTAEHERYLRMAGEVIPVIKVDKDPWKGQMNEREPQINYHLTPDVVNTSDTTALADAWQQRVPSEICIACGLRPQGPLKKSIERHVCDVCEQRRADRSKEWATEELATTIWIDETADISARLALIVGSFDLSNWLGGDLVRTMTVCDPVRSENKTADIVSKNPSFARLRRIWETTQEFWQKVFPANNENDDERSYAPISAIDDDGDAISLFKQVIEPSGPRFEIKGTLKPGAMQLEETPGDYHACDLVLPKGIRMSIVWDPIDKRFITADNLSYLKEQLGEAVKDILKEGTTWTIEEPTGYGSKNKVWGTITLDSDASPVPDSHYTPAIPILAEPRTFMALVPADKAMEVVNRIKAKYEREMGKVRNRLPLHLGIVYAHRRTPLRAILDAGRKMLNQSARPEGWKVACAARKLADRNDQLPERFSVDSKGQFKEWLEILLEKDGHRVNWFVPVMMGDGQTLDHWYPYVFMNGSSEPVDRDRRFRAPNPWTGSEGRLVHAADLKADDLVYFTPSTLDFQWLDSAGRRFEISYDDLGHRRSMARRPYLLDEVETLEHIWKMLKDHLSKNQIYILRDLIEAKREDWQLSASGLSKDDAFWNFCRQALANAEWKNGKLPWGAEGIDRERWLDLWADYAALGWIADAVELYLQIMKEEV